MGLLKSIWTSFVPGCLLAALSRSGAVVAETAIPGTAWNWNALGAHGTGDERIDALLKGCSSGLADCDLDLSSGHAALETPWMSGYRGARKTCHSEPQGNNLVCRIPIRHGAEILRTSG